MQSTIALMRRKPGLSMAEFADYYESSHVPLVMGILGDFIETYERHYLDYGHPFSRIAAGVGAADDGGQLFDVVTRVIWRDLPGARAKMSDPHFASLVTSDEENFLDRPTMQNVVVARHCLTGKAG